MTTSPVRCVVLTDHTVLFDGHRFDAHRAREFLSDGIDELLAWAARIVDPRTGGVVLLGQHGHGVHELLGLPADVPADAMSDHPVLQLAREAGWKVSAVAPWMTFWQFNRPAIHVGVLPWLNEQTFPLLDLNSLVKTSYRCAQFHNWVGVPFHGVSSGPAGVSLLRDHWRPRRKYGNPMWKPRNWDEVTPAGYPTEVAAHWRAPAGPAHEWEHGYDANFQYLSAAGVATFAIGALTHRTVPAGRESAVVQIRNLPGYYRTYVSDWEWEDVMPHPMGPKASRGEAVWIAAPTLDLVHQLARDDKIAPPQVYESWTAPGDRIMRQWAEQIRNAIIDATKHGDEVLVDAVKGCYKHGRGLLEKTYSRVHRPDWSHTIMATARCNLWRKIWAQGAEQWPTEIAADTVWYASPENDPYTYWPKHFPDYEGPGGFHHKGTRKGGTR